LPARAGDTASPPCSVLDALRSYQLASAAPAQGDRAIKAFSGTDIELSRSRWPNFNGLREDCTASPEQMAGQGAGVLSPLDHDNAIDDHRVDAVGVLVRVVEAGAIGNRLGVE
jgi:hypothetical protein